MSQIIGWSELNCTCGRKEFVAIVKLQSHIKLGVSAQPLGFQCLFCKRTLDTGRAMRTLQKEYLLQEMKEIEGEIEQISEPTSNGLDPEAT